MSRRDSAEVFSAIFSREFISSVLDDILQLNPDAFCRNTGGGGMRFTGLGKGCVSGLCL